MATFFFLALLLSPGTKYYLLKAKRIFNSRVLPDAVFPNNWFSTHPSFDGTLVLYPMLGSNRAKEKRQDIVDYIRDKFQVL